MQRHALRPAFGTFYWDSSGQRFYKLAIRFGIREGEQQPFIAHACPPLDSATYQPLSWCYARDKHGVYCDLTGVLPFGDITAVAAADAPTFRALNCRTLAVDKNHVFLNGSVVAGLAPRGLRAYAPGGHTYANDFDDELYLVTPTLMYRIGDEGPQLVQKPLRLPRGYRRVRLRPATVE